MKKLLKMYKGLPREMKMMIAMAGLSSPLGAIYLLKRFLFPNTSTFFIIIGVAAVIAVLGLLGLLISKIFGRKSRKRSRKMAADLAADGGAGPVSMDVGAAIKANNDKFFGAIRDMRKNIGISVYDLPWYIVIGDSGCGKTKLINEGGLQFSTGKPEGYQLGTLNYNWWFTEDAVFVDMAGRLCNPRDDADRREWEAFLNTIAKGRKGYPINGTVVCVSADHLLQDPPEKIEEFANTALERLRDLQTKLGVTFATYLVVTKCDKIVGFMQFFDRAERDITVLNQMFGWSKPGEFNELYDPDRLPSDFEDVYRRLYDLRLRRLNDEADEMDLGLAYSFPEEFRELLEPLQTYVRTLFPMIKNPRAIKNLLFRGIYFTSATREGGLILKHLTDRLGPEAAAQFAPLDLYPSKRPYFIKDLFFRKMFPEHGLVFRNEEQAVRNRKLAKLLKIGSVALGVALISLFVTSTYKFESVIGEPRAAAQEPPVTTPVLPHDALMMGGRLYTGIDTLEKNMLWARILSLWLGATEPIADLKTIEAALFEHVLLREALVDITRALKSPKPALPHPGDGEDARAKGQAYLDALTEYVRWYGCGDASMPHEQLDYASFQTLCKIVTDKESIIQKSGEKFQSQATRYFAVLKDRPDWGSPARLLDDERINPQEAILKGLVHASHYLKGYATLSDKHPDPDIREWMRIQVACARVDETYDQMLNASRGLLDTDTIEDLEAFTDTFLANFGDFDRSLGATSWALMTPGLSVEIPSLREAVFGQRENWLDYQAKLSGTYEACGAARDGVVADALTKLAEGDRNVRLPGLDIVLWDSLKDAKLTEANYHKAYFENLATFNTVVDELIDPYRHILSFQEGGETGDDKLTRTSDAIKVKQALSQIHQKLAALKLDLPVDPGLPSEWADDLYALSNGPLEEEEGADSLALGNLGQQWRPGELSALHRAHKTAINRAKGHVLLATIHKALGDVGDWGFAELLSDDYAGPVGSEYRIALPQRVEDTGRARASEDTPRKKDSRRRPRRRPRRGGRGERRPERPDRSGQPVVKQGGGKIPACATQSFLFDRTEECADLLNELHEFTPDFFLSSRLDEGEQLNEICRADVRRTAERYMETYVRRWADAYERRELTELKRLKEDADDWTGLAELIKKRGGGRRDRGSDAVAKELRKSLLGILEAIPFWDWRESDDGQWERAGETAYADWLSVEAWMQSAIEDNWPPDLGRFAGDAKLPTGELKGTNRNDRPWLALASEFELLWNNLSAAIRKNALLPTKFDRPPTERQLRDRHIPWGKIQDLRREARLDGERLTDGLVQFEEHAQQLLSEELSDILWRMQDRYFERAATKVGWPYRGEARKDGELLQTVDFDRFKRFLREVLWARDYFRPLEEGLPESDEPLQVRRVFYRSCDAWYKFLDIQDEGETLGTIDLLVDVDWIDPLGSETQALQARHQVDATAEQYYNTVELELRLEVKHEGDAEFKKTPLKIPTRVGRRSSSRSEARWTWDVETGKIPLKFKLVDGQQWEGHGERFRAVGQHLGNSSPLAFCAYLQDGDTIGGDRKNWVTVHTINLPKQLQKAGQRNLAKAVREKAGKGGKEAVNVGLGFRFELSRAMPAPIDPLRRTRR